MSSSTPMRRSLLVSPYFPPVGVSGTKRALHLSRNLGHFHWSPTVLTGLAVGEPIDKSLSECVPSHLTVSREYSGRLRPWLQARKEQKKRKKSLASLPLEQQNPKSTKPKSSKSLWQSIKPKNLQYWLPFDRYWLDGKAGYKAIKHLVESEKLEVIHVSADPWAPLVAAERVSRELNIPLVVDFRDPWSVHDGKMALRPKITRILLKRFEAKLFKQASAIILNTETARDVYIDRYKGRVPSSRFYAVRNAFDRGLFRQTPPQNNLKSTSGKIFSALYFGRFRAFVSPEQLFKGFVQFVKQQKLSPQEATLHLVGGLSDEHMRLAESLGLSDYLSISPPIPFRDSLQTLQSASVLVLVIEPECYMQIPGKLYDYFAAARPIIAISANQEANTMIRNVDMGQAVSHQDIDAITQAFTQAYQTWSKEPERSLQEREMQVEPYSAYSQAQKIAHIYETVCGN